MPIINTIAAISARGFGYGTEDAFGEQVFTTAGVYTFYVPAGVTKISIVAIGGGGAGSQLGTFPANSAPPTIWAPGGIGSSFPAGGGGALAYKNNVTVTPGQAVTVRVGAGAQSFNAFVSSAGNGGDSSVEVGGPTVVQAGGGKGGNGGGVGGVVIVGDGGGAGGAGGNWAYDNPASLWAGGSGGGAGGYSGTGGAGVNGGSSGATGGSGSGGGAGGGGQSATGGYTSGSNTFTLYTGGAAGGGTGLNGEGTSGTGGAGCTSPITSFSYTPAQGGNGGSGGSTGGEAGGPTLLSGGNNSESSAGTGTFGGGGGQGGSRSVVNGGNTTYTAFGGGSGGCGAVRIIWSTNPTVTRAFPSTNVGQL